MPVSHPQNRIGDEKMTGVAEENQDLANTDQREVESVPRGPSLEQHVLIDFPSQQHQIGMAFECLGSNA